MINLSFAGCGFLGIYHVGVASCFREYAPHVLVSKIAGASVGSIAAAALLCDVSLGRATTDILSVAVKARSGTLGPLSPRFDLNKLLRERLEEALPENAHQMCSGRLFISVTRWSDKKNVLLSQYNSRQELIQAILCSCFIPLYSGVNVPVFQGEKYVDGGMSDNLPVLDDNTITVSPFAGEHDICPQDESCNILQINLANTSIAVSPGNMYRFYRILFPPKPEILSRMCQQGFDDALKFLQRKRVITCTRCLGVQSTVKFRDSEQLEGGKATSITGEHHAFDDCLECRYKRQVASFGRLPEAVVDAIQDACDQVNKGVINWLYKRRPVRLMAFLSLPYTIPLDISILIFAKIWQQMPSLRKEIMAKFQAIILLAKLLLRKIDPDESLYSAMFSCELAITEYDYTEDNVSSSYSTPIANSQPHDTCLVRTEEEKTPRRKLSVRYSETPKIRQHRRSYAGFTSNWQPVAMEKIRRKSLSEVSRPERVIRNMKFGFNVDMQSEINKDQKKKDFFKSLKSLSDSVDSDLNIMQIADKALQMEREYISKYCANTAQEDNVGKVLDVSNNDAMMSYCYIAEDRTVKITEIYNVTDADTSMVLPDEERQVNQQLEWESNWIDPPELKQQRSTSFVDDLDDHEFATSDIECDLDQNNESFDESKNSSESELHLNEECVIKQPHRKTSFIIVN